MFELSCPKCGSSRIHRGYRQAPFYKRILGWQNLLCNGCNLLFTAFAWPGTIQSQSRRKRKAREEKSDIKRQTQEILLEAQSATPAGLRRALRREAENFEADSASESLPAPVMEAEEPMPALKPRIVLPTPEPKKFDESYSPAIKRRVSSDASPAKIVAQARNIETPSEEKKSREKTGSPRVPKQEPHKLDYARFAFYYAQLYLKVKLGTRKTSHSMEVKFRWQNWWHRQRALKQ